MKATELVLALQEAIAKHGDQPVYVDFYWYYGHYSQARELRVLSPAAGHEILPRPNKLPTALFIVD